MHIETASNRWRWRYERPPEAKAVVELRPLRGSHRWRQQQQREKGFAGSKTELAHEVALALRERGYSIREAWYGGHLVANGGTFNFEGNCRIAKWGKICLRTAQRARLKLERDGLIVSYIVAPGECVPGQARPVRRWQVVRDIRKLLGLVQSKARRYTPRRGKSPGAAVAHVQPHTPAAAPSTPAPKFNLHAAVSGWLAGKRETPKPETKRETPSKPAHVDPSEVDQWEQDTERTERGLDPKPSRAPPE